jgi:hypothetical protein
MSEQFFFPLLSALATATLGALGLLIKLLFSWRKAQLEEHKMLRDEIKESIDKFCSQNETAHQFIWRRINHHLHNADGRVVIVE